MGAKGKQRARKTARRGGGKAAGGLAQARTRYANGGLLPEQRAQANWDLGVTKRGNALDDFRSGAITAQQEAANSASASFAHDQRWRAGHQLTGTQRERVAGEAAGVEAAQRAVQQSAKSLLGGLGDAAIATGAPAAQTGGGSGLAPAAPAYVAPIDDGSHAAYDQPLIPAANPQSSTLGLLDQRVNLANGGMVDPRLGPPGRDTIPATVGGLRQVRQVRLDGGEFVLPKDTTRKVGPQALQRLVDATHRPVTAPGYANGGLLAGLFKGARGDRAAQIDAAVNGAVGAAAAPPAPSPAAPAPTAAPSSDGVPTSADMMRDFMRDVRKGYANGGLVDYGAWGRVADLEALNQERRQRTVFGRDPGAGDRRISDAEQAARAAPNTRLSAAGLGNNLPERRAPAPQTASSGPQWEARTDTGVGVDPRGRAAMAPPTVPGMYQGEPPAPPRSGGEYARAARMEAEAPALREDIARTLLASSASGAKPPGLTLFNPAQARKAQHDRARERDRAQGFPDREVHPVQALSDAVNGATGGYAERLGEVLSAPLRVPAQAISEGYQRNQERSRGLDQKIQARRNAQFAGLGRHRPSRYALGFDQLGAAPDAEGAAVDPRLAGGGGGVASPPGQMPLGGLAGIASGDGSGPVDGTPRAVSAAQLGAEHNAAFRANAAGLKHWGNVLQAGGTPVYASLGNDGAPIFGSTKAMASDWGLKNQPAHGPLGGSPFGTPDGGASLPGSARAEADRGIAAAWGALAPDQRGRMPDRVADALDRPRQGERYSEQEQFGRALAADARKRQGEQAKEQRGLSKDVFLRDYDAMLKAQTPESPAERTRAWREAATSGQKAIGDGLLKVFDPQAALNPQQAAEQQWRLGQANLIAGSLLAQYPQLAGEPQRVLGAVTASTSRMSPDGSNYDAVMAALLQALGLDQMGRQGGLAAAQ